MIKKISQTIILLFIQAIGFSQSVPVQTNLPSPNIASLGIFGEFPAISSTGVPDITIPLYEIKYDGINIQLSLQYNNNLVKPDQHPGWVGLGWNLNAGGAITRIINHVEDEANQTANSSLKRLGYYFNNTVFQQSDWATYQKAKNATDLENSGYPSWSRDSKPDEFAFSFLNFSGTFYLDENRNLKVRSNSKFEIEMTGVFQSFTITDSNGNKYFFGENDNDIEYSSPVIDINYLSFKKKSWNLSRIVTVNGKEIQFTYERGESLPSFQPLWQTNWHSPYGGFPEINWMTGSQIKPSFLTKIETPVSEILFSRSNSVELKYGTAEFESHRHFSDYEMSFNPNSFIPSFITFLNNSTSSTYATFASQVAQLFDNFRFQQLNRIQVKSTLDSKIIKNIDFGYTNSTSQRLKLLSVTLSSNKVYNFLYTDDFDNTLKLPPYCSGKTDIWGYYNGRNQDFTNTTTYFASKEPDAQKIQSELLKKIIYPTKGYSEYEFEPHTYSKEVADVRYNPLIINTQNKVGGGVRIKRVSNFDSNSNLTDFKNYFYTNTYNPAGPTGLSSGILGGQSYNYFIPASGGETKGSGTMFSKGPLFLSNNGPIIGYSKVIEVSSNNSYIIKTYSNFDNGNNNEYMDTGPFYSMGGYNKTGTSKAYERGRLLNESIYRVVTGIEKRISEKVFGYVRINETTNYLKTYDISYVGGSQGVTDYRTVAIKEGTYPYIMANVQEKIYDQQDPGNEAKAIVTSTEYNYNPVGQSTQAPDLFPRKITITNPSGEKIITENKYVNDYGEIVDPIGTSAGGIANLHTNKISAALIETVSYLQKIENSTTTNYYISGALNTYKEYPNGLGKLWNIYALKFNPGASFTSYTWSAINSKNFTFDVNKFKLIGIVDDYDADGNVLGITSSDGIKQNYTWGYGGTALTSLTLNSQDVNFKHSLNYWHQPLVGLTKISDQNGRESNFYYDTGQRLKLSKDHDGSILQRYRYHYKDEVEFKADFSISGTPKVGSSIAMNSLYDYEASGVTSYVWDFGDGQVADNSTKSVSHTYSQSGTYLVKLSKINPEYNSLTITKSFAVNSQPSVSVYVNKSSIDICTTTNPFVTISANTSGGCPGGLTYAYSYALDPQSTWTIIPGNTSSTTFDGNSATPGTYYIRCTITDTCQQVTTSSYTSITYYKSNPNCAGL